MVLMFWAAVAVVAYVYLGYPALLYCGARLSARRTQTIANPQSTRNPPSAIDRWPSLAIVIAARNEAQRLPARIENLLGLDYPADRRHIVVALDGSTDASRDALARFGDLVQVLEVP